VDNRRLEPGRAVPYGYPLFHTHRPSTAIQWLTCASWKSFTDPYTGRHGAWRRVGVIGASWHACLGIGWERGDLWPGDSAGSPTSGASSGRAATTCPLAGARPCRASLRRALAARAQEWARRRATEAPGWHRVCWAGPGTPADWQLRGIGKTGWLNLRRLNARPALTGRMAVVL